MLSAEAVLIIVALLVALTASTAFLLRGRGGRSDRLRRGSGTRPGRCDARPADGRTRAHPEQ